MTEHLPARLLVPPTFPTMSPALGFQVETIRKGGSYIPKGRDDESGLVLTAGKPEFDPAAVPALRSVEQLCGPFDQWIVRAWLTKLGTALKRRPTDGEIDARVAAVCMACTTIPYGVWCDETLIEAMRTFDWFPSAAEVFALLQPHALRLLGSRDALIRIVEADPERPREGVPEPTEEEKAAVADIVETFRRERSFNQDNLIPRMRLIRPKRSQDVALLAMYRALAAGPDRTKSAAASVRVDMLERKLGISQDMP